MPNAYRFLPPPTMSLPPYIATTLLITFILFLINVWWDRHWKLRNLPTPVCFLLSFYDPCYLVFEPDLVLTRRLVLLSSGATKSASSKTSMAINGVPGSMSAVEHSRSKPPGATQKS